MQHIQSVEILDFSKHQHYEVACEDHQRNFKGDVRKIKEQSAKKHEFSLLEDVPGKSFCGDWSIYFRVLFCYCCYGSFLFLSLFTCSPSANTVGSISNIDRKLAVSHCLLDSVTFHMSNYNHFLSSPYFPSWPATFLPHIIARS